MKVPNILYLLECGHRANEISTLVSGELYCVFHREMSPIADVQVQEWRMKCQSCTLARWAGMSQQSAEILAVGHTRRNPSHRVAVEWTVNPDALATQEKLIRYRAIRTQ